MSRLGLRAFTALALAVAIGLATAVSPWASSSPDGLQRVAGEKGFADRGRLHRVQADAPVAGYAVPGVRDARLAKGLAGFAGTLVVFGLGSGGAALLRRRGGGRPAYPSSVSGQ
ncbi:MAG: cobalt/nickel transport protein [Solirubrobacteraceae bacterium]|jgi:hypothetical protein|nr:cobalt/nickel transport protein [Solirubrobacteraceae bacterium]